MMQLSIRISEMILVLFLLASLAQAQSVGDKIVIITDNVEIKGRSGILDTTHAGAIFVVREVQKERFGINSVHGTGFIEKQHVIPLSQAVQHWTEVIRSEPEEASAYIGRGLAYRELRDYDKAITDYSEAIRLDPKSTAAFLNRGGVWSKKQDYDKAIEDYSEAIRLNPKYAGAYSNRGAAWRSKGDYDKAIANYNEAIRLDPKDAVAYYNRAHAWHNKEDLDKSVIDYSKAIQLDPVFVEAYVNRGHALVSRGDYESAISDFDEAIRLDPKYARPHNARAWIWATCPDAQFRNGKRAVASAVRALELDGRSNALGNIITLAAAYAEAGDFKNAILWQLRALELAPANQKADLQARLDLFQSNKPYRHELKKPTVAP